MHRSKHYRGGYQVAGLAAEAKTLRKDATAAEDFLWRKIRNRKLGFKFRRQHQFGDYIADFYCHEAHLVIECDGQLHERNEQWQHDQRRDAYLTGHGLRVLRFSNDQVLNDIDGTLDQILKFLPNK